MKTKIFARHLWLAILRVFVALSHAGCLTLMTSEQEGAVLEKPGPESRELQDRLSGLWEYRQGDIVYDLTLDQHVNGMYG